MTILDISTYQGSISEAAFAAMKASGIERVIHKAGGSNSGRYTDSHYRANMPNVKAAGLAKGHYWFNGTGDPTADADYFMANLVDYTLDDWLVIDVENEGSMAHWTPAQVHAWVKAVQAHQPKAIVVVYMSSSVTKAADWSQVVADGAQLWVAQYSAAEPTVDYWSHWIAWQYTSSGTVPDYAGRVDLSHEGGTTAVAGSGGSTVAPISEGGNESSHSIKEIQAAVGATVDGVWGPQTFADVKAWQAKHGLTADGIVGPKTAAVMFPAAKAKVNQLKVDGVWGAATTTRIQQVVGASPVDGDLGPNTYSHLQAHLGVEADGIWGPNSKRALQRHVGVAQDGIVGVQTIEAMQKRLNANTF